MDRSILNEGIINGHCITGNNNIFYYAMSDNINEVIISLAKSQEKLANAIADAMEKRAEADLIKAKTDKQCADNYATELKIREKEAENTSTLILSIQETLIKINSKLEI